MEPKCHFSDRLVYADLQGHLSVQIDRDQINAGVTSACSMMMRQSCGWSKDVSPRRAHPSVPGFACEGGDLQGSTTHLHLARTNLRIILIVT